jgi:hypothetical protein
MQMCKPQLCMPGVSRGQEILASEAVREQVVPNTFSHCVRSEPFCHPHMQQQPIVMRHGSVNGRSQSRTDSPPYALLAAPLRSPTP